MSTVTGGGVKEAVKVRFGCSRPVPFAVELVGMPFSMETTFVATKISRRLVLREECCSRGVGHGQQRWIYNSRPHG